MSRYVVKLPDLGEGTVSSEIVAWRVQVGERIAEDDPMVEMSTDKAVVEMPAPVSGTVVSLGGRPGDQIAVGAELIVLETDATAPRDESAGPSDSSAQASEPTVDMQPSAAAKSAAPVQRAARPEEFDAQPSASEQRAEPQAPKRVMASPATRRKAKEAGVDLSAIEGSGREGRILKRDLEAVLGAGGAAATRRSARGMTAPRTETEEIRILGVRRVSAQRVAESKRTIPHFSYVDEVDVTELEKLRRHLNGKLPEGSAPFTYLPFLAMALVRVIERLPKCNARFDAERNVLVQHRGVHLGVATQTSTGLKVPVVRHAETLSLHQIAAEIRRVSAAARNGTASRNELSGSTITITSLGKLGGIASTPIINAPEVAIIGVNKALERPVVRHGAIAVRLLMNLSCSFDHRFIDGYDAAETVQALKEYLEQPATIFIPDSD
ncbi:MAG TPA: dihydrolipoamide acetyltransferase family protein [Steroidobacter sp.]|jgi:2-oxoisovalerate dehydrogenase E2 component (dihydrolipoyl transacylase)|nr:dihydrolipoamide acetyltransferase family protein [Steroidobacteraceae bacterium]HLS82103.1 dihydrolipoamide acetyltransferase family protein [Steroidobacter sp.]